MLSWLRWLLDLISKAPTLKLWFEPPEFSLLPQAWLKAHKISVPPLCSRVGIENFGASVLRKLRIKLEPSPDYSIEGLGLPTVAWRYVEASNEIEIDAIDPHSTLTFLLFFDAPTGSQAPPQLLCDGALVGVRSEWRWLLYSYPGALAIQGVTTLAAIAITVFFVIFIYRERFSPEARTRDDYFNRYVLSRGMRACTLRTLNADHGEVHEGEIRRHINGIADALVLNRSSSLDELLKRKRVFVCATADE